MRRSSARRSRRRPACSGLFMPQVIRVEGSDAAIGRGDRRAAGLSHCREKEGPRSLPAFDAVVIANPASPDAAAAVGLAAARRLPMLFVGQNSVPAETRPRSARRSSTSRRRSSSANSSVVSSDVLTAMPTATRLGGANQYETSKAVVTESKQRGMPSNVVYAADGSQPMDAALLGGVVARATGMLVLAAAPRAQTAADGGLELRLDRGQRCSGSSPPPVRRRRRRHRHRRHHRRPPPHHRRRRSRRRRRPHRRRRLRAAMTRRRRQRSSSRSHDPEARAQLGTTITCTLRAVHGGRQGEEHRRRRSAGWRPRLHRCASEAPHGEARKRRRAQGRADASRRRPARGSCGHCEARKPVSAKFTVTVSGCRRQQAYAVATVRFKR